MANQEFCPENEVDLADKPKAMATQEVNKTTLVWQIFLIGQINQNYIFCSI